MGIYNDFADVYDIFMSNAPYDKWVVYILEIWEKLNHSPKLVLDLACGTGNITTRLADKGFDMIGIDISEQMLMKAKEKSEESDFDILYLCQDISEFELFGTVDSIVCICDGINYLLEEEQLLNTFKLVNNYLNDAGIFIFDTNTEYKFKNILSDNNFSYVDDMTAYIWENYYFEQEKINEYNTTFFVKDEKSKLYQRFEESHHERAYSISKIKEALEKSGLKLLHIYDDLTFNEPKKESERVFYVAQKI